MWQPPPTPFADAMAALLGIVFAAMVVVALSSCTVGGHVVTNCG